MINQSKKFSLNAIDARKVLKGATIAAAGAFITVLLQAFKLIDFGVYQGIAAAINAVLVNLVYKFTKGD